MSERALKAAGSFFCGSRVVFGTDQGDTFQARTLDGNIGVFVQGTLAALYKPEGEAVFHKVTIEEGFSIGGGSIEEGDYHSTVITGGLKTDIILFERVGSDVLQCPAIGDASRIITDTESGIVIDNAYNPSEPTAAHDVRLFFPTNNDQNAVMFNTSPTTGTAGIEIRQDIQGAIQNDPKIFQQFTMASTFSAEFLPYDPANNPTPQVVDVGYIGENQGDMGFAKQLESNFFDFPNPGDTVFTLEAMDGEKALAFISYTPVKYYNLLNRSGITHSGLIPQICADVKTTHSTLLGKVADHTPDFEVNISDINGNPIETRNYIHTQNMLNILWAAVHYLGIDKLRTTTP